ncbi:MAG: hypothetical protein ACREQO_03245 [Candidatus Binatia bacterium]
MGTLSKTQIDGLGERLKKGFPSEADLRMLDEYRRSFSPAYESVIGTIRDKLQMEPTGRPAKSTSSIAEKLRRESIRLSQIQDIAGCRVVVTDIIAQDQTVATLRKTFPRTKTVDRRPKSSHGYRAVHMIVEIEGKDVEVQLRSYLQHLWAELSERLSDVVDSSIKYGGGDNNTRTLLAEGSAQVEDLENLEVGLESPSTRLGALKPNETENLRGRIKRLENNLAANLRKYIQLTEGQRLQRR